MNQRVAETLKARQTPLIHRRNGENDFLGAVLLQFVTPILKAFELKVGSVAEMGNVALNDGLTRLRPGPWRRPERGRDESRDDPHLGPSVPTSCQTSSP